MAYTKQEIEMAINVLNRPSKHIKPVYKADNGIDFLSYSAELVRAFEVAIEVLEEKNNQLN